MSQGSRPDRVADQIRGELASLIAREVHDPGIGFVTLTRVQVTADLQLARVYYTSIATTSAGSPGNDAGARKNTALALERASSFLRRRIGQTLRLRRTPALEFHYDESIAGQDRIEQLLNEIHGAPDHPADDDNNDQS
jgi:ribosome-binding factor A